MSVFHRWLVASLCMLLMVAAWLLVETAPQSAMPTAGPPRWVRTREGWRRAEWHQPHTVPEPRLHPGLVAAFVSLASATALVAFPPRRLGPQSVREELPAS